MSISGKTIIALPLIFIQQLSESNLMIPFFLKGKNRSGFYLIITTLADIHQSGYKIGLTYSVPDFGITKLNLKFVNPVTRKNELHEMVLGEITGKE